MLSYDIEKKLIHSFRGSYINYNLEFVAHEKANEYFSMFIYVLIVCGAILTLIGALNMEKIAALLGAKEDVLDYCVEYGGLLIFGITAFLLQNCFQSFLVVAEKPAFGLIITVCAGVTNMVLDFLFIYVLDLKLTGAALATTISQVLGAIIPLIYFIRKNNSKLKLVLTKINLKVLLKACGNGSSEMVTNLSLSLVNMLYNLQLLEYAGTNGVIAYGVIMYIGFIFIGTYLGYSIGTAPIVGYHYGAKNTDELKSLFKKSIRLLIVISILMTGVAELIARPLSSVFVGYDKEILD